MPKQELSAEEIADLLGETEAQPRKHLKALVRTLGPIATAALLDAVRTIEAQGGLIMPNGCRRTPGGVFFYLTRVGYFLGPRSWAETKYIQQQQERYAQQQDMAELIADEP
jgi:hypothetical protein